MAPEFIKLLHSRMKEKNPRIQIILGPRQVGKTTGIEMMIKADSRHQYHLVSGDGIPNGNWIQEQWQSALESNSILVIDEIQKIPEWSEIIKKLWDKNTQAKKHLKCILLGSSSLFLQKGMSESLTGRFEVIQVYHWNYINSNRLKKMKLEIYLKFGGYPGAYAYINETKRWSEYLASSIVETVLMKDILAQSRVKSPALFRQAFYILLNCPAQILSYNKILGQLQDRGNIDLVKYYIDLFEGAFLLKSIYNFTRNEMRKKGTSPKIISLAPALNTFHRLDKLDSEYMGRVFESIVGAKLVQNFNSVSYWSKGDFEVDFVIEYKNKIIAIEVKSGRNKKSTSLDKFVSQYPEAEIVFLTKENFLSFDKNPRQFIEKIVF